MLAGVTVDGRVWEVVGGADKGGVLVRIARELSSPAEPVRLTVGSLLVERELLGDRLRYDRIAGTGYGPDSGWVSVRARNTDLVVPADYAPPREGWKVLHRELPAWEPVPPPRQAPPALALTDGAGENFSGGPMSVTGPQTPQVAGQPYVYYHQCGFNDSKRTGLRMSACLVCMDECRTDAFAITDQSVESFREATDPFTSVAIELKPRILQLGEDAGGPDGLLYTHPRSRGVILSWLRVEARYGWPMFPLRNEEQNLYLVGKSRSGDSREALARGRFQNAFVDENTKGAMAPGSHWEQDFERFWSRVKQDHSAEELNERRLEKMYPSSMRPFKPTLFRKVSWRMPYVFIDCWGILYHVKAPEVLWEVNMLVGGPFEALVKAECDPQALCMSLPKKMEVGELYDVFCFLEETSMKAVYIVMLGGSTKPTDCVLCVTALYKWAGVPEDGCTLTSEDFQVCDVVTRNILLAWADEKDVKPSKVLDLSSLSRT